MSLENNFFKDIQQESPFDFSRHSSIGVGGCAKTAYYPNSISQMKALLTWLYEEKISYYVVGNMTNILPTDKTTDTVIVCTKKLTGMQAQNCVFVEAGVMSGCFLNGCREAKKSGAEFLVGIPCTLGGALYMNAGVKERYIAEIVESVLVFREGKMELLSQKECGYSYKTSSFMDGKSVILGATLHLTDGDRERIEKEKRYFLEKRAHLPKGKSMGCVFKNPNGETAGALIEKAGLKGARFGGAFISNTHANFIINDKNATAADVKDLIALIKKTVFEKYKVSLEEEIRYLR